MQSPFQENPFRKRICHVFSADNSGSLVSAFYWFAPRTRRHFSVYDVPLIRRRASTSSSSCFRSSARRRLGRWKSTMLSKFTVSELNNHCALCRTQSGGFIDLLLCSRTGSLWIRPRLSVPWQNFLYPWRSSSPLKVFFLPAPKHAGLRIVFTFS